MTQLRRSLETSIFVGPNPNFVRTIFLKINLTDRPIKKRSIFGFLDHFLQSYPLSPFNPVKNSNHVRTRVTSAQRYARPRWALRLRRAHALPRVALHPRWALLIKYITLYHDHDTHLQFVATSSHLAAVQKMAWGLTSKDAIETGLLSPFLYGDTDIVAAEVANSRVELILSGGGNPSSADTTQDLKNSINMPASNASVRYIRRLKIMACAILPSQHVLTNWLQNHDRDMQSLSLNFEQWTPSLSPHLVPARGILYCKWVATKLSVWVKNQGVSPQAIVLPSFSFQFISDTIQSEDIWEPTLSAAVCTRYKIYDICYVSPPPPFLPPMPHGHGPVGLRPSPTSSLEPTRASPSSSSSPSSRSGLHQSQLCFASLLVLQGASFQKSYYSEENQEW